MLSATVWWLHFDKSCVAIIIDLEANTHRLSNLYTVYEKLR